jgi:integrase
MSSNPTQPCPEQLTLSIFDGGDDMGRRRGQRPTKNNPFKRNGKWYVRYREGESELADGSRKRDSHTKYLAEAKGPEALTKKQADRKAWDEVFSKIDDHVLNPRSAATVNQFLKAKYEPDILPLHKKHGREDKVSILKQHVVPAIGAKKLRDVGVETVKRLLQEKLAGGLSTQRVKHIRNTISSIFRYARELGFFSGQLPTDFRWRVKMQRVRRRGSLLFEQAYLLMEALPELAVLIRFLLVTGCRVGEACGLRWRNVNLSGEAVMSGETRIPPRTVAIVEAWVRGEYTSVKVEGAHERLMPLSDGLCEALEKHLAAATFGLPEHPVFASTKGTPLDHHNIAKRKLKPAIAAINEKIEAEGLTVPKLPAELSWHWLRHTNASLTDQEGMSAVERQKVLGHTDPAMTMRYSHAELEHMRAGLERVDGRLMRKPAGREKVVSIASKRKA